jgi:hypothetical protein
MNIATLDRERFQQNDLSTQLNLLAGNLAQIQSLMMTGMEAERVVCLVRESLYFIEWMVPRYLKVDIDGAADLVNLGRVLAQWRFNWEKIWEDAEVRVETAQRIENLLDQVKRLMT